MHSLLPGDAKLGCAQPEIPATTHCAHAALSPTMAPSQMVWQDCRSASLFPDAQWAVHAAWHRWDCSEPEDPPLLPQPTAASNASATTSRGADRGPHTAHHIQRRYHEDEVWVHCAARSWPGRRPAGP
jgi:hypothetical protein